MLKAMVFFDDPYLLPALALSYIHNLWILTVNPAGDGGGGGGGGGDSGS